MDSADVKHTTNHIESPEGASFVKARRIAGIYSVSVEIVYKWAKAGKIPSIRFQDTVRFDETAVRAAIEGGAA
jgi:excisionase family DNA binding protein